MSLSRCIASLMDVIDTNSDVLVSRASWKRLVAAAAMAGLPDLYEMTCNVNGDSSTFPVPKHNLELEPRNLKTNSTHDWLVGASPPPSRGWLSVSVWQYE